MLVGASGCGKSTLLRIVAGLERADEGEVSHGGEPITAPSARRGFVFQEHRLLPWLSVADNIAFGLRHLAPAAKELAIGTQLARVRLSEFAHAYPHQLSGGMAQRAALARALAPLPDILLLDEPFAALDTFTRAHLQAELRDLQRSQGCAVLLVTHDIEEAIFLADRVHVLAQYPGAICRSIDVQLPHPRDRTSEEFTRLRRLVLEEFAAHASPGALTQPRLESLHPTFIPDLTPREIA